MSVQSTIRVIFGSGERRRITHVRLSLRRSDTRSQQRVEQWCSRQGQSSLLHLATRCVDEARALSALPDPPRGGIGGKWKLGDLHAFRGNGHYDPRICEIQSDAEL